MSGNKVVRVTYSFEDDFLIPSNINLENKEQVVDWWIRYNTLHVELKNGKILEINSRGRCDDIDMKHTDHEEILDADEAGYDNEDFKEEDLGEAEDDSDDDTFLGEEDTEEVVLKECKVTSEPASNEKIEQMWKAMGLPVASDETSNEASDDETTHCNICLEPSTDKFDMKCDTCKEGYICSDCQNNIVPNGILWADADDVKSAIKCPCCRILNWKSYYSQFIEYGLNYDLEEYEPEEYNNAVQVYLRNKNL